MEPPVKCSIANIFNYSKLDLALILGEHLGGISPGAVDSDIAISDLVLQTVSAHNLALTILAHDSTYF